VDNFPSTPSEKKPDKVLAVFGIEELNENLDLNFVRERIEKRPRDVIRIVFRSFEITDRSVISTPRYRLRFRKLKTNEEKILVLDRVTSKRI